jgi:hypothetical protein
MEISISLSELKIGDYLLLTDKQKKRLNVVTSWAMVKMVALTSTTRIYTQYGVVKKNRNCANFIVYRFLPKEEYKHFQEWKEEYTKARLERYFQFIKIFKRGSYVDKDGYIRPMHGNHR